MTGDEFRASYKLLKLVDEPGSQSYHALNPKGRVVMVHMLEGLPVEERRRLLGLVDGLTPADRARIFDTLDVDGAPVIVTEFIQGFRGLGAWLESKSKQRPAAAPAAPAAPAAAPRAGEFTRLFGAVRETPEVPAAESPPGSPPAASGPGEFTGLFGPADLPQEASALHPPARAPGDFTRMFGAGAPAPEQPPAEPPVSDRPLVRWRQEGAPEEARRPKPIIRWKGPSSEPLAAPEPGPPAPAGDFTRLFGAAGSPLPEVAPRTAPASSQPPPGPGQFTRMFNAPAEPSSAPSAPPLDALAQDSERYLRALDAPANPPSRAAPGPGPTPSVPANAAREPGEFTRLMAGMLAPASGGPSPAPSAPPAARGPGPSAGPSEFTRLVAAVPPPKAAPPSAAQATTEPESPKPRLPKLPIIFLAVGFVFLAAIALYFVLR